MPGASSGIGAIYAKGVRPQGWTTAFAEQSENFFADTLAEDVTLEASATGIALLSGVLIGNFLVVAPLTPTAPGIPEAGNAENDSKTVRNRHAAVF